MSFPTHIKQVNFDDEISNSVIKWILSMSFQTQMNFTEISNWIFVNGNPKPNLNFVEISNSIVYVAFKLNRSVKM